MLCCCYSALCFGLFKKLDLPVAIPVTTNQVLEFNATSRLGQTGGRNHLKLTDINHFLDGRISVTALLKVTLIARPGADSHFFGCGEIERKRSVENCSRCDQKAWL